MPADQVHTLRAPGAAHAAEAALPWQRVYDVVTAAHELAANAIRHGAGHGRLRLWADGRAVHCQVSDDGPAERDVTPPDAAAWQRQHGLDRASAAVPGVVDQHAAAWTAT